MEDYGKSASGDSWGRFRKKDYISYHKPIKNERKTNKADSKVGWKVSADTRRSSQESAKSKDSMTLKINSKHGSKYGTSLKQRTSSQHSFQDESINLNNRQEQQLNSRSKKENISEARTKQNQLFEPDQREQNILAKKKISNLKLMINQTKELLALTQAMILAEELKTMKSKVMETEITVRRMRIGSRRNLRQKNIISEYYNKDQTTRASKIQKKSTGSVTRSRRQYSLCQYYDKESKSQFQKQRKALLRARMNSIRECISTEKEKSKKKHDLINQEIRAIRMESEKFADITNKTESYTLSLQQKLSSFLVGQKTTSSSKKISRHTSANQYQTTIIA